MELLMNYTRILKRAQATTETSDEEPLFLLLLFDFVFARNISIGSRRKVCCKYFIGKVCGKWLLGRSPGPNKLGAKLAVIGFYVRCLQEHWQEHEQQGGAVEVEHNLIFVCPSGQKLLTLLMFIAK